MAASERQSSRSSKAGHPSQVGIGKPPELGVERGFYGSRTPGAFCHGMGRLETVLGGWGGGCTLLYV